MLRFDVQRQLITFDCSSWIYFFLKSYTPSVWVVFISPLELILSFWTWVSPELFDLNMMWIFTCSWFSIKRFFVFFVFFRFQIFWKGPGYYLLIFPEKKMYNIDKIFQQMGGIPSLESSPWFQHCGITLIITWIFRESFLRYVIVFNILYSLQFPVFFIEQVLFIGNQLYRFSWVW